MTKTRKTLFWTTAVAALVASTPAFSQDRPAGAASVDEIIVTARKRDETAISVPVALTAVGGAELERRAINTMDGLARVVPTLVIGDNSAQQGGIVAIRGLAGADTNPFGDQAVSFNVDGVGIGRASIRRMSEMDLAQIEVLKGPQALFFGKNSPAGIISIRTADPTDSLSAKLSAGYEFNADEIRTEGHISGPLGETLGVRVAGYFSDMKGWSKNIGPRTGPGVIPSVGTRAPNSTDYAGRLTLKWEPSSDFDARFKFTYGKVKNNGPTANNQIVDCPLGVPQGGYALDGCRADDKVSTGSIGTIPGQIYDARFGDGDTFLKQRQILAGLELNWRPMDALTVTSMTGYYNLVSQFAGVFTNNNVETQTFPRTLLPSYQKLELKEFSQELRAASDFEGAFNFMVGGYYQQTRGRTESSTFFNVFNPGYVNNLLFKQKGTAWSVFGQALIDITPELELSAGGRYSYEKKRLPVALSATSATRTTLYDITGPNYVRARNWDNFSPEASLAWKPSPNLTVYGSYKEGFLSGGFDANNPPGFAGTAPTTQGLNTYNPQETKGFELGVKTAALDGDLRMNLAVYSYKTQGLQVTVTNITQVELRNAGSVRTKGAEFDFTYRPPVDGLKLRGAIAYTKGTYLDYQASCYRGQSSDSCFSQVNRVTGQVSLLQDLSGTRLVRAPRWTGNAGFDYETPVGANMKLGLSGNLSFSSGYFTNVTSSPGGWQKNYSLVDGSVRLAQTDDHWEVALIGRNLTDKYYIVRSSDIPFTGTAPGTAVVGVLADTASVPSRGREVMLRLTVRFGN